MKRYNIRAHNKIKKPPAERGERETILSGTYIFSKKDLMHHMKLHKREQISHMYFYKTLKYFI